MKKSELKSGMIGVLRNGDVGLFVVNTFITNNNGGVSLYMLNDNLKWISSSNDDCDIMSVYSLDCKKDGFTGNMKFWMEDNNFLTYATLLWERNEVKEYTLQEIADKMGVDVNSIRIKD